VWSCTHYTTFVLSIYHNDITAIYRITYYKFGRQCAVPFRQDPNGADRIDTNSYTRIIYYIYIYIYINNVYAHTQLINVELKSPLWVTEVGRTWFTTVSRDNNITSSRVHGSPSCAEQRQRGGGGQCRFWIIKLSLYIYTHTYIYIYIYSRLQYIYYMLYTIYLYNMSSKSLKFWPYTFCRRRRLLHQGTDK